MKSLLNRSFTTLTGLAVMTVMFFVPQASQARMHLFIEGGIAGGDGGAGEGDPYDSNDHDISGNGDEVHDQRIIPRGFGPGSMHFLSADQSAILQVDYVDGIPVFTIQIHSLDGLSAEGKNVQ